MDKFRSLHLNDTSYKHLVDSDDGDDDIINENINYIDNQKITNINNNSIILSKNQQNKPTMLVRPTRQIIPNQTIRKSYFRPSTRPSIHRNG